jgi:TM2 domain-containing membrane protein YozV
MNCPFCKEEIQEGALKCKHCGSMLVATGTDNMLTNENKSRIAAILLAFFLGGVGIYKFYLGSWGWGIIYLLFVWTFIPALISLVEFIRYLILSDSEFQQKVDSLDGGPFSFLW